MIGYSGRFGGKGDVFRAFWYIGSDMETLACEESGQWVGDMVHSGGAMSWPTPGNWLSGELWISLPSSCHAVFWNKSSVRRHYAPETLSSLDTILSTNTHRAPDRTSSLPECARFFQTIEILQKIYSLSYVYPLLFSMGSVGAECGLISHLPLHRLKVMEAPVLQCRRDQELHRN